MTKLYPNLSGILPEKEAKNYENWFRQQVEKSLASRMRIPSSGWRLLNKDGSSSVRCSLYRDSDGTQQKDGCWSTSDTPQQVTGC